MDWYNEPPEWSESEDALTVTVAGDTDFWRHTLHDFVADDAHFYHREVSGDFTATVKLTGEYETQYDQAGLMIREDESTWLKCGVELLDGTQQAGAVITRDVSDWSVLPLESDPESAWIRVERIGSAVEVSYSLDGETFTLLRQGYLSDAERLQVGPMAAAPQGEGFKVTFEHFSVE
jgi:regulation of enolase protein 1 (concanavalin A-like superfamily)